MIEGTEHDYVNSSDEEQARCGADSQNESKKSSKKSPWKPFVTEFDDIDAPQWVDFSAPSPHIQPDDSFFHKRANNSMTQQTPVKKTCSSKISSAKKNKLKETTYENVLTEAMNNLQLSFKNNKSFNKSCLIDSPAFKTPVNRVTRSMCAQVINTPQYEQEESHASLKKEDLKETHSCEQYEENKENLKLEAHESSNEQISHLTLEVTTTSTDYETSQEKFEPELIVEEQTHDDKVEKKAEELNKELPKSKIVTSFAQHKSGSNRGLKKKVSTLTGTAWQRQMKRRMSITNQRRQSMTKPLVQNKYVSMAEAITKFQQVTPQRFHSTTVKTTKTVQLRRVSLKLTRATSPALTCKNRSRPVTAISSEEKERIELEKIRQNQIKANPVPQNILKKPAPLKKVVKKSVTNPEPFHLTETKKAQPLPKPVQEVERIHKMFVKTVPAIVRAKDNSVVIKNEEVLHYGIPLKPSQSKKKNTKVMPFSFEARTKELEQRKQEKLKILQQSENQKLKAEFHARPVPAAVKTPLNKFPLKKENSAKKITLTRTLSFEERNKQIQKKKEEKIQQSLEEEKKARSFKAHPVPEFKPVLVRGRSRDNLLKRSNENLSVKSQNRSDNLKKSNNSLKKSIENLLVKPSSPVKRSLRIPFVAPKKKSSTSGSMENQENKLQDAVPKIMLPKCKLSQKSVAVLSELNTDKRAKQRKEFDEKIKVKETEEEEMKKKEETERLEKEKLEKLELRKETEHKARPMPVYKPMHIVKSNKPLTDAQSPAWAKRNKGSTH